MKFVKKIIWIIAGAFVFSHIPTAFAHERWFLSLPKEQIMRMPKPFVFTQWDNFNVPIILSAFAIFLIAVSAHFILNDERWVKSLKKNFRRFFIYTFLLVRTLTGALLLIAALNSRFFAPDLLLSRHILLMSFEFLIGIGLVIGIYPRLFGGFGALLYLSGFFFFDALDLLHYIVLFGIFLFLFIAGDSSLPKIKTAVSFRDTKLVLWLEERKAYAFSILRIGFGLSLIIAALLNKLLLPQFALIFLDQHPVNFLAATFWQVSNAQFVFICGITELVIGLFVFFGILPRLCGALLIIVFTLGLTVFGIHELVGHLPLYAVAFGLLTGGAGEKWSLE